MSEDSVKDFSYSLVDCMMSVFKKPDVDVDNYLYWFEEMVNYDTYKGDFCKLMWRENALYAVIKNHGYFECHEDATKEYISWLAEKEILGGRVDE